MEGIIVVDKIPKNCQECGMYYTSALGGFGCVVSHRFISENAANKRKKPDWCPIRHQINELNELEEYRKLGTMEEVREAVEIQTSKKPDYEGDGYADSQLVYDTWICPNCGRRYELDYDDYKHCPECGQKIDWSDEE